MMSTNSEGSFRWVKYLCYILVVLSILGVCFFSSFLYIKQLNDPSSNFPINTDIDLGEGLSHTEISEQLESTQVIQSALLMRVILHFYFKDQFAHAGIYEFSEATTTYGVAYALVNGTHKTPRLSATFPEGFKVSDFYLFLPKEHAYEQVDLGAYEGFLFPDTYFVTKEMSTQDIIAMMQTNFDKKLAPYTEKMEKSGLTKKELIILASIVEREAKDTDSKKMVAGILHNRLSINMPLQVDATLDYILNKTSAELTEDDLKLDSPFNTYVHAGLPPAPIANPGIESILAVLEPTESKYIYYLTGDNGTFHYAKTFEEHKRNKNLYIK